MGIAHLRAWDGLTIFRQDSMGAFTAPLVALQPGPAVLDDPRAIALGDVDGDGDLDVASANRVSLSGARGSRSQILAARSAAGGFGERSPPKTKTGEEGGNLKDSHPSSAGEPDGNLTVFRQTAPGRFEATPGANLAPGAAFLKNPQAPALGDLDGDGDVEVVAVAGDDSDDRNGVAAFSRSAP